MDLDKIKWQVPEPYPQEIRDPMVVYITRPKTGEMIKKPIISGIVFSDNPTAIINSQIMHMGDAIGEIKVIKIDKSCVQFQHKDKIWTQRVNQ